ncbi:MAG: NADH-quinone oxidoreductase subunit J, partial [Verrucomicrobia bacterium]|nr:NADH-quinone oxidoreductase subunit J [Verrucomicrobiota bacterium]
ALSLIVTFGCLGLIYLGLGAEFLGLAQVMVYAGAVAILIVFAVMLTGNREPDAKNVFGRPAAWGAGAAALAGGGALLGALAGAAFRDRPPAEVSAPPAVLGKALMTEYAVPLLVLATLLTAALVGAVLIASMGPGGEKRPEREI